MNIFEATFSAEEYKRLTREMFDPGLRARLEKEMMDNIDNIARTISFDEELKRCCCETRPWTTTSSGTFGNNPFSCPDFEPKVAGPQPKSNEVIKGQREYEKVNAIDVEFMEVKE